MEQNRDEYLLGTIQDLFKWSGTAGDAPRIVGSNYDNFFSKGINNSLGFEDLVAVVDYPGGITLIERSSNHVKGYVKPKSSDELGEIFKIRKAGDGSFLLLGTEGIGEVDLKPSSRFFPTVELFEGQDYRMSAGSSDKVFLFSEENWIQLLDDGFWKGELPRAVSWTGVDFSGAPVFGNVNGYFSFDDGKWDLDYLSEPIEDFIIGDEIAYALGVSGIFTVDAERNMTRIFESDGNYRLLGEYAEELYLLDKDGSIDALKKDGDEWSLRKDIFKVEGEVSDFGVGDGGITISTGNALHFFGADGYRVDELSPDWEVSDLDISGVGKTYLFTNSSTREVAVGYEDGTTKAMLSVPNLDQLGDPLDIICNDTRIAVVGTQGVGWYAIDELEQVSVPEVDLDLLFENKRIEDRTIPSGMHFIDLQVEFANPEIPCQVQYRINEQRWRTVSPQDPTLQFAGHGSFMVELRAIHPNGNTSALKVIQFGISPPWYLNPVYQGLMLLVAIVLMAVLYYLRSRQLKRTNLWLQSEVRKQTRELEAATAARTNFLAGLSHDIRNPLNGVLMIAETLTRNPPKSGDDQRLQDLTEFGVIVDRMLGEILDFSAIDQSNIPTTFIPVSVVDIIESTVKQNQYGIQHEMVMLNKVIPEDLKDVVIRTDRNWMIKILSNLLINSLEYSGAETIEVGAKCNRITDREVELEIYVSDWGQGIDESEKEFIFERFYRGESGIESGKHGTGLGLSICLEIAHAMGAHLFLEDNEPSGCKFILRGKFERAEGQKELDREAILATLSGKRILIVDDLVYNRKSILEFFQTIGCECDEAENGRDALSKLNDNEYYLALLDWDLPGLTGPEIARRHRKANPEDKVIMISVTAYTDGEKKRESEQAGMNGYISKPLTATRLAYCLANIEDWKPWREKNPDFVDSDEVLEEIYRHIEDCLLFGERYEWENLRRCAHRLTTLALMRNNKPMQQVCRDLQIAAQNEDLKESQTLLLELHQWRRP
ncbi:MAG: response regulator [Puniceicoccaceae bacterium]